jgi:hypothetical protein
MELEELLLDPFSRLDAYVSSSLLLIEPSPFVSIALKSSSADVVVPVAESSCAASSIRPSRDWVESALELVTELEALDSMLFKYVVSSDLLIEPSPFVSIALNRFEDDDVDEVELACRISCSR